MTSKKRKARIYMYICKQKINQLVHVQFNFIGIKQISSQSMVQQTGGTSISSFLWLISLQVNLKLMILKILQDILLTGLDWIRRHFFMYVITSSITNFLQQGISKFPSIKSSRGKKTNSIAFIDLVMRNKNKPGKQA